MGILFLFLFLLGCFFAYGDEFDEPVKLAETAIEEAVAPSVCIRGVVLIDDPENVGTLGEDCAGVQFYQFDPPGPNRSLQQILCSILIDQELSKERIIEAEEAINCYYKEWNHPLVIVYTPEQKIRNGIVYLVIIESKIGNISFCGNQHFTSCQLRKHLCLQENDCIDVQTIQQDLIWINRNPFRNAFLVLNPGCEEYTTDLQFVVDDHRPYRIFVGSDNTGYDSTGKERLFAGIRMGNLFWSDHQLSYQYTTSTEFGRFYAHTAQYIAPLPWRHLLDFYGGYSGIRAEMPISGMFSKGHAWQGSARYIIPFCPRGCYHHELRLGFDYKQTDVNFILDAIPILGNETVITQLALGYSGSLQNCVANTSFEFLWYYSPGDIFPHQSDRAYQTLRPFAKSKYTYIRGSVVPIFALPYCGEFVVRSEFQWASENLLSSEQLGLGGLDTVRGYDQRILNTDNGLFLSGEIRTRGFKPLCHKYCTARYEQLQLLAFLDYGFGTNHKPIPGAKNFFYLLGTGVGFRYHYNYNVSIRFNWGYPLHMKIANNIEQNNSTINYSVIVSF